MARKCRDCEGEGVHTRRKAPHPGPRCTTHHRKLKKQRKAAARARHVEATYSISEDEYQAIYEAQGRVCAICQRVRGTTGKRLSVDHDHSCCPGPTSCGQCVRGLLCRTCNAEVLGHLRDDPAALRRAIDYLRAPPAGAVLERTNQ